VPSTGETEVIEVDAADRWASLNFIGAATFATIKFSIDEHPMWVYEVDGQYVEPQLVDSVNMYAGERYSVLIKLDKKPGNYTIRVADNGLTQIISAFATLKYKGGRDIGESKASIDYGGQNTTAEVTMLDNFHLPPFPNIAPAKESDDEFILYTHRFHSPWEYTLGGAGKYAEDRSAYSPLLYHPNSPDAMDEGLVIRTRNGTWVDLIIQVGSLPDQPQEFPHMIHKHSSKTWQIGTGVGIWNYSSVAHAIETAPEYFNLVNPNYRDTFITSFDGPSWIVLRYQVTNPGAWLLHCHIETHLAGGMAMAILDGVDAWPEIPPEYAIGQHGYHPQPKTSDHRPWQGYSGYQDVLSGGRERIYQYTDFSAALIAKFTKFVEDLFI
jgi:FtsP/CotA-like multicopper oxidase with cupredoxin domain